MKVSMKYLARITVALGFLSFFTSSEVQASRARNLVMGSGDGNTYLDLGGSGGSFFYNSPYNIFYNPALITSFGNWAIIEKSNFVESTPNYDANKQFNPSVPGSVHSGDTAQGGFIMAVLQFRLAMFFNRVAAIDSVYENRTNFRPIDIIFGAEAATYKWGFGLTYGSYRGNQIGRDATNTSDVTTGKKESDMDLTLRAGAVWMDLEPFVAAKVIGSEKTVNPKQSYQDYRAGVKYTYGEWMPIVAYKFVKSGPHRGHTYGFGLGRATRISEPVKLIMSLGWWHKYRMAQQYLPIAMAVEGEVLSWLTLRGGLTYYILSRSGDTTTADNTSGRLGATFRLGDLDFDFAVGKTIAGGAEPGAVADAQNFDLSNGLFSAASLSYRW